MARLLYLEEAHAEFLIMLTGELFVGSPAFRLRVPEGGGLLASALAVPRQPNYRTLPQKAAALQYHLSMNHPFFDGNKRFAVAAMETFITLNSATLLTTDSKLVEISLGVANHEIDKPKLIRMIERRTFRINWPESTLNRWVSGLSQVEESDLFDALSQHASGESAMHDRIYDALIRQHDQFPGATPFPDRR
jgi:death-on-curing protein